MIVIFPPLYWPWKPKTSTSLSLLLGVVCGGSEVIFSLTFCLFSTVSKYLFRSRVTWGIHSYNVVFNSSEEFKRRGVHRILEKTRQKKISWTEQTSLSVKPFNFEREQNNSQINCHCVVIIIGTRKWYTSYCFNLETDKFFVFRRATVVNIVYSLDLWLSRNAFYESMVPVWSKYSNHILSIDGLRLFFRDCGRGSKPNAENYTRCNV